MNRLNATRRIGRCVMISSQPLSIAKRRAHSEWALIIRYSKLSTSQRITAFGTSFMLALLKQVSLDLLNKSGGNGDLGFSGHSETYDGLDCVAVFDGNSWRLELLTGTLKVRCVSTDQSHKFAALSC